MGSDEITPDNSIEQPDRMEYSLVWFTNGYQPTKKSVCNSLLPDHIQYEHNFDFTYMTFLCVYLNFTYFLDTLEHRGQFEQNILIM